MVSTKLNRKAICFATKGNRPVREGSRNYPGTCVPKTYTNRRRYGMGKEI